MREYGKVFSRIWESADFRRLSEDGQKLVLYLLTCQHGTLAGVFRVPDGYAAEDLQWTSERVAEGFKELFRNGFANRCEATKWVWVTNYLDWNPLENPNQRKAASRIVQSVPANCGWKRDFLRVCGRFVGLEPPPEDNPPGTVSKGLPNQEQEQEQEKEKPPKPPRGAEVVDPRFDAFYAAYPRKVAKQRAAKAFAKLKADDAVLSLLVAAIERQKHSDDWRRDGGQYIPHPATWLNDRRWEDGQGGDAPASDARPEWAITAGFSNRFEAENAGCYAHNATSFAGGRRQGAA